MSAKIGQEVSLGQRVQDVVTGVEGIAIVRSDFWHGSTRIEIQPPKKKDGSVPEIHVADEAQIIILDAKPILPVPKAPPARFEYGQKAKDPISGYAGTVNGRAVFLNGCVRVCVQAHQKDYIKGAAKIDAGVWLPEEVLEPAGWTIKPKAKGTQKIASEKQRPPGGPAPRTTREPRATI